MWKFMQSLTSCIPSGSLFLSRDTNWTTSDLWGSTDVIETQIEAGSVTEVFSLLLSQVTSKARCLSKLDCVIRVSFNASSNDNEAGLNGENFLLLSPPKDLIRYLSESNVLTKSAQKIGSSLDYEITLRSNGISLFVWLSLKNDNGIEGTFSRNGIMMFDKELKVIFTSKREVTAGELQYRLKIETLRRKRIERRLRKRPISLSLSLAILCCKK